MIWTLVLCSLLLLGAWQTRCAAAEVHNHAPHVAFVFAGSARSFTEQFVHESIRMNLIHSFCPPKLCHAVLFFRVSLGDNVHQDASGKTIADGSGMMVPADPDTVKIVNFAIGRLAKMPGLNRSVPSVITWAEVGSPAEKDEIVKDFPSMRSKLFTLLDSRRYSMYYNRHKAFMQMPVYEQLHGIEFQWVVHVRLDALWGEPVQPVFFWNSLDANVNHRFDKFPVRGGQSVPVAPRVWVVDTWYDDVPDTFALIPRSLADKYFDVETLAADGVMCLGGPNVNTELISSATHLAALQLSSAEVAEVHALKCPDQEEGGSEKILKRKLERLGITVDAGTLGYQTFFTAMVRPRVADDMCFYLEQHRLIGWVWPRQYSNEATFPACLMFVATVRQFRDQVAANTLNLAKASTGALTGPTTYKRSSTRPFESVCTLDAVGEYTGANCLLAKSQTDWNFMPFRLHVDRQCLTLNLTDESLRTELCVQWQTYGEDWNSTYSALQLVHFFPLVRAAQPLRIMSGEDFLCLTTADADGSAGGQRTVRALPCFDIGDGNSKRQQDQMFVVRGLSAQSDLWSSHSSREQFLVTRAAIPRARLPAVATVSVALAGNPEDAELLLQWQKGLVSKPNPQLLCISLLSKNATSAGDEGVMLRHCDHMDQSQHIVIERSSTVAWIKYIRKRIDNEHYKTAT